MEFRSRAEQLKASGINQYLIIAVYPKASMVGLMCQPCHSVKPIVTFQC